MPDFQWPYLGVFVGGEVVPKEMMLINERTEFVTEKMKTLSEMATPLAPLLSSAIQQLAGMAPEAISAHIIDKISLGQKEVAVDIVGPAVAYRSAGGDEAAAQAVAAVLSQPNAKLGWNLQAISDHSRSVGDKQSAADYGYRAAVQLGIAEQTKLQAVLWDDPIVKSFAIAGVAVQLAYPKAHLIGADIPISAIPGWTIRPPNTRFEGLGVTLEFPRVWDLDYRIDVAKNGFAELYRVVHAPAAIGNTANLDMVRSYVEAAHWKAVPKPSWGQPGEKNAWSTGFKPVN